MIAFVIITILGVISLLVFLFFWALCIAAGNMDDRMGLK